MRGCSKCGNSGCNCVITAGTGISITGLGTDSSPFVITSLAEGAIAANSFWDAKGDLAVGTGVDTAARLAVGANGFVLTADSTTATGLKWAAAVGAGDASTNTATSVDGEAVLFSGTTGKIVRRSTLTGMMKSTSGVLSVASPSTDYYAPGGTDVAATDGGTGQSVYAVGDILYASTTTALSKLADIATGNALISGGVGTAPSWGKIGIASHVSGLGTGIATALGVAVGAAGAPVLFNGAGGTPTSLVLTNATGLVASTGTTATGTPSSTTYLRGDNTWATPAGGGGSGDFSSNTATSVVNEIVLFADTSGKLGKRSTGTGLAKLTSGVLSTATAGTDYYAPGSTDVAVADGGTGVSTLTGIVKGNGASAFSAATAGTDYTSPTSTETMTNKTLTAPRFASGGFIADANGNEEIIFTTTASAINEITVANAAAGTSPTIAATGGDTDVNLILDAKGAGKIRVKQALVSDAVVLTDAATVTIDGSHGNHFTLLATAGIGATRALGNPTNMAEGQEFTVTYTQDGAGSKALTFGTDYAFGTDVPSYTATTTASKRDVLKFKWDATLSKAMIIGIAKGY